jgi:hypothetical protein
MTGFFDLNHALFLVPFCTNWITSKVFSKLDSAICNKIDRPIFLGNILGHDFCVLYFSKEDMHNGMTWIVQRFQKQVYNGKIRFDEKYIQIHNFQNRSVDVIRRNNFMASPYQEHLQTLETNQMSFMAVLCYGSNGISPTVSELKNTDQISVDIHVYPYRLPQDACIFPIFCEQMNTTMRNGYLKYEVKTRANYSLNTLTSLCHLDLVRHGKINHVRHLFNRSYILLL